MAPSTPWKDLRFLDPGKKIGLERKLRLRLVDSFRRAEFRIHPTRGVECPAGVGGGGVKSQTRTVFGCRSQTRTEFRTDLVGTLHTTSHGTDAGEQGTVTLRVRKRGATG